MADVPTYTASASTIVDSSNDREIESFFSLLQSVDVGPTPYAILAVFVGASILISKIMRETTIKKAVENDHIYRMAALEQNRNVLGAPLVEGLMKAKKEQKVLKFPTHGHHLEAAE